MLVANRDAPTMSHVSRRPARKKFALFSVARPATRGGARKRARPDNNQADDPIQWCERQGHNASKVCSAKVSKRLIHVRDTVIISPSALLAKCCSGEGGHRILCFGILIKDPETRHLDLKQAAEKGYFDAENDPIWHLVERRINNLQMSVSAVVSAPGTFSATC